MPAHPPKVWTEAVIPEELLRKMEALYERLLALPFAVDRGGEDVPADIPLSSDARTLWVEFYNRHARLQAEASSGALAAAFSKLEGYAARFALIIHIVSSVGRTDEAPWRVDAESMAAGIELAEWFVHEVQRVYRALAETDEERERRELVELVQVRGGRITCRELMRAKRRYRDSAEEARAALDDLVDAGLGHWVRKGPGPKGGQPTEAFVLEVPSPSPPPEVESMEFGEDDES